MKKNIRRKGFTLVELLIVIVVIGILSAMMMLSSTEAVSSAKASRIIADLRNLKTAALAVYVDSYDVFKNAKGADAGGSNSDATSIEKRAAFVSAVKRHLNSNVEGLSTSAEAGTYSFYNGDKYNQLEWYVIYKLRSSEKDVKQKLISRASSVGLIKGRNGTNKNKPFDGTNSDNTEGNDGNAVYMRIM